MPPPPFCRRRRPRFAPLSLPRRRPLCPWQLVLALLLVSEGTKKGQRAWHRPRARLSWAASFSGPLRRLLRPLSAPSRVEGRRREKKRGKVWEWGTARLRSAAGSSGKKIQNLCFFPVGTQKKGRGAPPLSQLCVSSLFLAPALQLRARPRQGALSGLRIFEARSLNPFREGTRKKKRDQCFA